MDLLFKRGVVNIHIISATSKVLDISIEVVGEHLKPELIVGDETKKVVKICCDVTENYYFLRAKADG